LARAPTDAGAISPSAFPATALLGEQARLGDVIDDSIVREIEKKGFNERLYWQTKP